MPPDSVAAGPIVAADRLRERLHAVETQAEVGDVLRAALDEGRARARQRLQTGEHGIAVARALAACADEILSALFDHIRARVFKTMATARGERLALVAVGGYGRGELAPHSDIDLLFLRGPRTSPYTDAVIQGMLYVLWDLGLKVGHASRGVGEALRLARSDYTIRTTLLEARFLAGDENLAQELFDRFRSEVVDRDQAGFVSAKLRERDERHARAGASRYMVEPNLKEGKGGLRDIHTLVWLLRHRYSYGASQASAVQDVFAASDREVMRRCARFLWTVRCHLHDIAGRAEERLTFDVQPELARRMGFAGRGAQTGVERFMKRYFLATKQVGVLTRTVCAKLEADNAKRIPHGLRRFSVVARQAGAPIEEGFRLEGGRLTFADGNVLARPANMLRLFEIAERRDLDVHPDALAAVTKRWRGLGAHWRKDPAAIEAFLGVMSSKRHPTAALQLMNETGVLGKFVPEFGRIVGKMQFNMYHHYTVDEHTLYGIEALSEIENGRYRDIHPLSTQIFPKIINRRALYLAMLLHDTGKGEGDQQVEGAKSARAACERMGLPGEETELIVWLVANHLEMSDVAQKRDLSDPRTILQFAERVENIERLRLLLVLTVADIRAVGPTLWNNWKGQLLRDLYRLTEAVLRGGRSSEDDVRRQLAENAAEKKRQMLEAMGPLASAVVPWFDLIEDGYWLSNDADALIWHAREVAYARGQGGPHAAARICAEQGVTEVLVHARDRTGLFASLAAAFSVAGANILSARIYTAQDGTVFDVFAIQTTDVRPFGADNPATLRALLDRLTRAAGVDCEAPATKMASRRMAAFAIDPWVRFDNDLTPVATVIEASGRDRIGLLAELASVCADAGVAIVSAHIDTHGERATDVFYVQESAGGQITQPRRIAALQAKLEAVLAAPGAAPPGAPLAVARASTAR
jgi:[protein-PII] uridylyltransferase